MFLVSENYLILPFSRLALKDFAKGLFYKTSLKVKKAVFFSEQP